MNKKKFVEEKLNDKDIHKRMCINCGHLSRFEFDEFKFKVSGFCCGYDDHYISVTEMFGWCKHWCKPKQENSKDKKDEKERDK